ncbi:MAG: hypothetical protein IPK03_07570 [Bacteroidetes bacterium]|nr:hypothetical protein [Bacteroidota bacterium]
MARKKKSEEEKELDKHFSEEEQLSIENDILKLKIETELGGEMQNMGEFNLPAEVENQFLKHIYEFQKLHLSAKKVPILVYLGSPKLTPIAEIEAKQSWKSERKNLEKLMKKNGIILNVMHRYKDDVIYKFIVDEMFKLEVNDVKLKGGFLHFIYEDFHPNHAKDIKKTVFEFFDITFNKDKENKTGLEFIVHDMLDLNGENFSKASFIAHIESIGEFLPDIAEIKISNFKVKEEAQKVIVKGSAVFSDNTLHNFILDFIKTDFLWEICKIDFPILSSKK